MEGIKFWLMFLFGWLTAPIKPRIVLDEKPEHFGWNEYEGKRKGESKEYD